jgi:hypothetical protein
MILKTSYLVALHCRNLVNRVAPYPTLEGEIKSSLVHRRSVKAHFNGTVKKGAKTAQAALPRPFFAPEASRRPAPDKGADAKKSGFRRLFAKGANFVFRGGEAKTGRVRIRREREPSPSPPFIENNLRGKEGAAHCARYIFTERRCAERGRLSRKGGCVGDVQDGRRVFCVAFAAHRHDASKKRRRFFSRLSFNKIHRRLVQARRLIDFCS